MSAACGSRTDASITNPAVLNSHGVTLPAGPLGIGNSSTSVVSATPAAIAANYDFPLGNGGATGPIALVETDVPSQAALFAALNQYRVALGEAPMSPAQFQVLSGSNDPGTPNGEITLDVSVLAVGRAQQHATALLLRRAARPTTPTSRRSSTSRTIRRW